MCAIPVWILPDAINLAIFAIASMVHTLYNMITGHKLYIMLQRECMKPIASVVERMDDGYQYDAVRRIGIYEYWAKSREDMVGAARAGADACCDCDERVAAWDGLCGRGICEWH